MTEHNDMKGISMHLSFVHSGFRR